MKSYQSSSFWSGFEKSAAVSMKGIKSGLNSLHLNQPKSMQTTLSKFTPSKVPTAVQKSSASHNVSTKLHNYGSTTNVPKSGTPDLSTIR